MILHCIVLLPRNIKTLLLLDLSKCQVKHIMFYLIIFFISGICLFLYQQYSLVHSYNCSLFESGCPTSSFVSYKLFERKSRRSHITISPKVQNIAEAK